MARSTLSVALISCDGAPYLEQQLDSIVRQSRRPDQIVIGDDGSRDASLSLIERFAGSCDVPLECLRHPARLGASRNLEQVIAQTCGEIVVFADQDDVWLPHKLQHIATALEQDPSAGAVFSDGYLIDADGRALPGSLFGWLGFGAAARARFAGAGAFGELIRRNVVVGATLAVRRTLLLELLPFEPGWVHDYYLALVLAARGQLRVLAEPLILYRRHAGQQLGIADASLAAALRLIRRQSAQGSREEAQRFERLAERLSGLGVALAREQLDALAGKAVFLRRRAEMRARRRAAPGLIWSGLRDGGYRRYAAGYEQALLDVLAIGAGG